MPKKEIGVRIPSNEILRELLLRLEQPLISTSLVYNFEEDAENNWNLIEEKYKHHVDLFIKDYIEDVGESTIIDCREESIELIRQGKVIIEV
jgi:tRNA A37 threonylcarbamoyladenosine synthetase subunit TsaC/SUA5/YrdC